MTTPPPVTASLPSLRVPIRVAVHPADSIAPRTMSGPGVAQTTPALTDILTRGVDVLDATHDPTIHRIPLTAGLAALVDTADRTLIEGFNWTLTGNGYVIAWRNQWHVQLHRLIAGAGPDELVDHHNGDKLDNRTANLRIATPSQNSANRGPDRRQLGKSSRHKGVSWDKTRGLWSVFVHHQGRTRHKGRFASEDEAARAYNEAALEIWGEFARLNDVEGITTDGR